MKLNAKQSLVTVGLALGLAACGPKLQSVADNQNDSTNNNGAARETVAVGVSITEKGAGFRLAGATSYSMSLEGCASGLTYPAITQSSSSIDVYKYDQGCVVKLNSFIVGGITYSPTVGDPFDFWTPGDSATFAETGVPNNKFTVSVVTQLNSTITGTESISYTFTQLIAGADELIAKTVVGDSHSISLSGVDAAAVDITGVTMTGMNPAGAGKFTFKVECTSAVTGSAGNYTCSGHALSSLKYVLIEDTAAYNGAVTAAQAATLFSGTVGTVAAGDQFGTGAGINGGFNASDLYGPSAMHTHPNMLFVVQSGGTSYKYFNVNVETLTP